MAPDARCNSMNETSKRKIAHLDMDAFFAAVEQLDCPKYRGKPVIVGGLGPRGVVATASYEAREYGVKSAMPMAKARRLCPQAIYLAPRFSRYQEVSARILEILRSYTPVVETISLDEAFFDLTESEAAFGPAEEIVAEVKHRVYTKTTLTCSVGLAHNRFLAKLASEFSKPDGLKIIRVKEVQTFLDPLSVESIWGVGKVTGRRLKSLGLQTVQDLRQAPIELLVRELGAIGRTLFRLARGEDDTPVQPTRESRSLSREVTLSVDLYEKAEMERFLRQFAREVAAELRHKRLLGKTVRVKVRFSNFETITRQISLSAGTDSTLLIEGLVLDLFRRRVSLGNRGVRLIGAGVSGLSESTARQLPLFSANESILDRTVDRLTQQYGEDVVWRGREI
jgi:DNA polymerase-4